MDNERDNPKRVFEVGPITERLVLRRMVAGDAADFFALNSNALVMRYTHEPQILSVEAARSAIEAYPDFRRVGYGRWGCFLKGDDRFIGFCGLKYLVDDDEVDVGYRLMPEFWGQGFATEAARASIKFGFQTIGLQRIVGHVLPENAASIRVLEKCGLKYQSEFFDGGLRVLAYAIERSES